MKLTPPELEAIDRNHARLAAFGDRAQTLDMFATGTGAEELTLLGETLAAPTTHTTTTPSPQLSFVL